MFICMVTCDKSINGNNTINKVIFVLYESYIILGNKYIWSISENKASFPHKKSVGWYEIMYAIIPRFKLTNFQSVKKIDN